MSDASVFVSSTIYDLGDIRNAVAEHLRETGLTPVLSETGSVLYDASEPLDESCYRKIKECDFFVLIIGGRYGSPASKRNPKGKNVSYKSVVSEEYRTARDAGIPIYVFVKSAVFTELATFKNNRGNHATKYAYVDTTKIFEFIEEIQAESKNNAIQPFSNLDDIVGFLRKQFGGILKRYSETKRHELGAPATGAANPQGGINPYKLFYYSLTKDVTVRELSRRTGISHGYIRRLLNGFDPVANPRPPISANEFPQLDLTVRSNIEKALDLHQGTLAPGNEDDLHAVYLSFWASFKGKQLARPAVKEHPQAMFQSRIIVLDFDGTMTWSDGNKTTWELIWQEAGLSVDLCRKLHAQARAGLITHPEWCDITLKEFRKAGVSKATCDAAIRKTILMKGVGEVLEELHKRNKRLYVLSGSVRHVIEKVLGDYLRYFSGIQANEFVFSEQGFLEDIRGTKFDFRGKPKYIQQIIDETKCNPLDILYIGNSYNDIFVSGVGARTLCVNPHHTDPDEPKWWTYCERDVDDFRVVLKYLFEGPSAYDDMDD